MLHTWCPQWLHAHIFPKLVSEGHLWLLSGNSEGLAAVLHPQASHGLASHLECAPLLTRSSLIHPCNRPSSVSFHTWGTPEGYEFGAQLGYTAEDYRVFTNASPNTLPLPLFPFNVSALSWLKSQLWENRGRKEGRIFNEVRWCRGKFP